MEDPDSTKLSTWKEFSEETKRWSAYGIALNHVLIPSIRPILEETVLKEYNSLKPKRRMNGHLLNGFAVPVGVNHTKSDANNKKKLINFNDKVTSHIEYAKLFLKKDMRDFSAFDETCDASVVLCLFGKIDSFPAALQNAANHVQKGRDIWVRYKSSEWNDDGFQDRFHDMTQLVKEVGLSPSDKCKVLEGLSTYKRRGFGTLSSESFLTRSHKINDPVTKVGNHVPISKFICHLVNKVVQHYTLNSLPINTESPNFAEQKIISQLLDSTSEIKVMFAETLHSLDLFESYLNCPSEESTVLLKRLFEDRKCSYTKPITPDEIEGFLETSRSLLLAIKPNDKESDEPKDCDQDNCISGNGNLDSDFNSQPNSISPPLSPNYESRKNMLEDMNLNGNEMPKNAVNSCDYNNPENALKCKHYLSQASSESKAETEAKDFACSVEDFNGQQRDKDKRDKASENKVLSHFNVPQIKKVRQGKELRGQIRYSGDERKMIIKKMSKENTLKARNSPHFVYPPALIISPREKELEDENLSLKKKVKSLQIHNKEILLELGQITVEKTAKENEEKRSEYFRQLFHSSLHEEKRFGTSNSRKDGWTHIFKQSSDPNSSSRRPVTNRNPSPPILNGAEALVQENNLQPDNESKVTNDEKQKEFQGGSHESASTVSVNGDQQTATNQNTPSIQSGEQSSGEEEANQFRGNHDQAITSREDYGDLSFSVQQHDSGRESISLSNVPPTSVATTLYNNYKFLLLSLAQNLLSSDVVMLQDWAAQNFSINNPRNATDILLQLDQKGVINASDLHQLSDFFESINRFDLVHIIDAFLLGDYNLLRQSQASKKHTENLLQNHGHRAILRNPGFPNAASTRQFSMNTNRNLGTSMKSGNSNGAQNSLPQTQPQFLGNFSDTANSTHFVRSMKNQPTAATQSNPNKPATGFNSVKMAEIAVGGSEVINERRTTSGSAGTRTTPSGSNGTGNTPTVSSNGSKHSKFQHPDREGSNSAHWDPDSDGNWLCSHYKRHCYVKFDCCDKFWPCHRCHNNQSTCGRKKLKSRDTRMLKCVYCNKVQQFGEHCCNCGAKFASYYCGLCKHLTGKDDHPYHCEKCGICRIHGDRSFHCDVCGVCLDVQLRGNHKCREGSAHDECCICLEDAFTGCQILPCSHKVHKECATQMIRSGITRCPICRESFAHKLERRPQDSRKRPGK